MKNKLDPKDCKHFNFGVDAKVGRLTNVGGGDVTGYKMDLTVKCVDCNMPFEFIGVPVGERFDKPMVSVDFKTLRLPIRPDTDSVGSGASYQFERPKETENKDKN